MIARLIARWSGFLKQEAALSFALIFFSLNVLGAECRSFEAWLSLREQLQVSSERSEIVEAEYDARATLAENIFESYLREDFSSAMIEQCIPEKADRDALQIVLSQAFLQGSLRTLRSARLVELDRLLNLLDQQGMALFRAVPHYPGKDGHENTARAGVYRNSRSLFMNYDNIPAGEWLYLLVHELAHYVDPVLHQVSATWNDEKLSAELFVVGKMHPKHEQLTKAQQSLLKKYVRAGLDRGLLAEYRAWKLCLSVYEQGKQQRLWQSVSWMEDLLHLRKAGESLDNFIFRYLDDTFTDPEFTGLFSLPIMQQEYFRQREELRLKPATR